MHNIEDVIARFHEIVETAQKFIPVKILTIDEPILKESEGEPGHWHWDATIGFEGYKITYPMEYHPFCDDDPESVAESIEVSFRQIQELETSQ